MRHRTPPVLALGVLSVLAALHAQQRRVLRRTLHRLGIKLSKDGGVWFAAFPLENSEILLPLEGAKNMKNAYESTLEILGQGAPPVHSGPPWPLEQIVLTPHEKLGWAYHIPCLRCRGTLLPLGLNAQVPVKIARALSGRKLPPNKCLSCRARAIRAGIVPCEGLWFDAESATWQWAEQVEGHTISLPLEAGYYTSSKRLEDLRRRLSGKRPPYDQQNDPA